MVQKALLDVVQAILEQADSLPAMSQGLYRMNVFVYKDTNEIAPDIRNHDDRKQIGHMLTIPGRASLRCRSRLTSGQLRTYAKCLITSIIISISLCS